VDNESGLDRDRRAEQWATAGERPRDDTAGTGAPPAAERSRAMARAAGEVTVPVWALPPEERAALLRIVQAGGRAQCRGPAREQMMALLEAGYLAPYGEGAVILTPAALQAIASEVDRRASARTAEADDAEAGEAGTENPADGDPAGEAGP
jgi:hypothetical protein